MHGGSTSNTTHACMHACTVGGAIICPAQALNPAKQAIPMRHKQQTLALVHCVRALTIPMHALKTRVLPAAALLRAAAYAGSLSCDHGVPPWSKGGSDRDSDKYFE